MRALLGAASGGAAGAWLGSPPGSGAPKFQVTKGAHYAPSVADRQPRSVEITIVARARKMSRDEGLSSMSAKTDRPRLPVSGPASPLLSAFAKKNRRLPG